MKCLARWTYSSWRPPPSWGVIQQLGVVQSG